jgi:hypothetical protein
VLWSALWHPFNAILLALAATAVATSDAATAAIMAVMVTASTALRFWQARAEALWWSAIHTTVAYVQRQPACRDGHNGTCQTALSLRWGALCSRLFLARC